MIKTYYSVSPATKYTFDCKPIRKLIKRHMGLTFFDPFPYPFTKDALSYMANAPDKSETRIILDPPYSDNQLLKSYKRAGGFSITGNPGYWSAIKSEAARIIKPGGLVMCLGWNSTGLGKGRGCSKEILLVVNHGAQHNDTLILIERKHNSLSEYL